MCAACTSSSRVASSSCSRLRAKKKKRVGGRERERKWYIYVWVCITRSVCMGMCVCICVYMYVCLSGWKRWLGGDRAAPTNNALIPWLLSTSYYLYIYLFQSLLMSCTPRYALSLAHVISDASCEDGGTVSRRRNRGIESLKHRQLRLVQIAFCVSDEYEIDMLLFLLFFSGIFIT